MAGRLRAVFVLVLVGSFCSIARAETLVGGIVGFGSSWILNSVSSVSNKPLYRNSAGIVCEYDLYKYFGIGVGLLLEQRGYEETDISSYYRGTIEAIYDQSYLEIPVTLQWHFPLCKRYLPYIFVGGSIHALLNYHNTVYPDYSEIYPVDANNTSPWDFTIPFGLGMMASFLQYRVGIEARYDVGVCSITKEITYREIPNGIGNGISQIAATENQLRSSSFQISLIWFVNCSRTGAKK